MAFDSREVHRTQMVVDCHGKRLLFLTLGLTQTLHEAHHVARAALARSRIPWLLLQALSRRVTCEGLDPPHGACGQEGCRWLRIKWAKRSRLPTAHRSGIIGPLERE